MRAKSFVGIDLHKSTLTIGVRDRDGELISNNTFPTKCVGKIMESICELPRPIHCAIESVGMYEWLWDMLDGKVDRLLLADSVELRYRAGKRKAKTDKIDARFISLLMYRDEIPESFVPDKTIRELRKLGRHWHRTTQTMSDIKIRMRWILLQHNQRGPKNINGASAQKWLLAYGERLSTMAAFSFAQLLETIEQMERQRSIMRRHILEFCRMDRFKDDITLLKTVPGISDVLAAIILAEVAGFCRFHSAGAAACYTGLTERTKESGGHVIHGHISKAGSPTLRWALCEAANTLVRSDPHYRAIYNRILKNTKIKAKAKTAMGQKLVRWLWKMHQTREPFRRGGSTGHTEKANKARVRAKANRPKAGMELQPELATA